MKLYLLSIFLSLVLLSGCSSYNKKDYSDLRNPLDFTDNSESLSIKEYDNLSIFNDLKNVLISSGNFKNGIYTLSYAEHPEQDGGDSVTYYVCYNTNTDELSLSSSIYTFSNNTSFIQVHIPLNTDNIVVCNIIVDTNNSSYIEMSKNVNLSNLSFTYNNAKLSANSAYNYICTTLEGCNKLLLRYSLSVKDLGFY